jgi:hypothetical protein
LELQNLIKASKGLKEELFRTKLFEEILIFIEKKS